MKKIFLFLCAWAIILTSSQAQPDFQIRKVIVFKNGLVFFQKEAEVTAGRSLDLPTLPIEPEDHDNLLLGRGMKVPVVFGTVNWSLPYNADNEVLSATTIVQEEMVDQDAQNLKDLIELNADKEVCFWLKDSTSPECGTLVKSFVVASNRIVLQKGEQLHLIDIDDVSKLEFTGGTTMKKEVTQKKQGIELSFAAPVNQDRLNVSYLQKGMAWMPNYQMIIDGEGKAELKLYANLMNDVEPLDDIPVYFALGIPSFKYDNLAEPLFTRAHVLNFLSSLEGVPENYDHSSYANVITYQRSNVNAGVGNTLANDGGDLEDNIYLYHYPGVTLYKGGTGHFKLFSQEVKYSDVYRVDLNEGNQWRNEKEQENIVWHTIVFKNAQDVPLTTGTINFSSKNGNSLKPIGQGVLDFIPANANGSVKMVRVPDIWVGDIQTEISRKEDVRGYRDLVTVKGEVTIKNFKKEGNIKMSINHTLTGKLIDSSIKSWTAKETFNQRDKNNPSTQVEWIIDIGADEELSFTYTYQLYAD